MNERLNRFISLLKQIFELDKSDLDFGIYRVMNLRKAQIEEFLTERLPQMVQETLAPFAQGSKEEIRAKMKQIEDSVSEMGMTVDALPDTAQKKQQYLQLQKQLAEGADLAALETDVYSALYSFFNRYYEDGDFISKRRYKEGVYAIPYEGEEVKLYWANQDQYYIKTSENFKDYTFVFDGITVHFRLVDATTEQNNNKENKDSKRTFMLFTEDEETHPGIKRFEYDPDAAEIVIRFVYDIPADKKKKYAEENYAAITQWLLSLRRAELNPLIAPIPTGKGRETTTLLEKHLKGYVDNHAAELVDKSLYLLRNKSKVGMGFFEAGNFYPDYILWIDTPETQYISFIDPKGLMHIRPDDPKIEFYKTIKELETRLAPTADGKTVVLNSFIMSGTPASQLRQWWLMERPQREEKNVYTIDNPECVELMIDRILGK